MKAFRFACTLCKLFRSSFSNLAMLFWFSQLQTVVASVLRAGGTFILQHRKAGPAKEFT
jgi:hypothetical protein